MYFVHTQYVPSQQSLGSWGTPALRSLGPSPTTCIVPMVVEDYHLNRALKQPLKLVTVPADILFAEVLDFCSNQGSLLCLIGG